MFTTRAPGHVAWICDSARAVNASPPTTTVRARTPTFEVVMTCAIADGAPLTSRRESGSANSSASASTLRTTSTVPPHASVPRISNTDTSKLSDVDASIRDSSAAENSAPIQQT